MQNELEYRWDDLRIVLALIREGTLSGAAERLGVNASTAGRRLDALEDALGVELFERGPDGVKPTHVAEQLFPIAEAVERSVGDVARTIEGLETEPEGLVRITAPPGVASHFVGARLGPLFKRFPRLHIEVDASIGYADLTRREADIALRSYRPSSGDLVATLVGRARPVMLASARYAKKLGRVRDVDELSWITWGPDLAHMEHARWIAKHVDDSRVVLRTSSIHTQIEAAAAGVGVVLLEPVFTQATSLVQVEVSRPVSRQLDELGQGELWMVGHRALRGVPRVAAVWDFLLEDARGLLEG